MEPNRISRRRAENNSYLVAFHVETHFVVVAGPRGYHSCGCGSELTFAADHDIFLEITFLAAYQQIRRRRKYLPNPLSAG
jgi:hypothetical protein